MSAPHETILVVDDMPANLRLLTTALTEQGYRVRAALGGVPALRTMLADPPDMVLLDINMPDLDGYTVFDRMKAHPVLRDVPVLFVSAVADTKSKIRAFYRGGMDFIAKPFQLEEVFARVATHMELRRLRKRLESNNRELEHVVAEQVREISDSQVATIVALAKLAERRDDDTGAHIDRIGSFASVLARARFDHQMDDSRQVNEFVDVLARAAALHDIGKVGIADAVLLKPGRLDADEFSVIKRHPLIGYETLNAVLESYPRNEMVRVGTYIARSHHERWDGAGYPDGLKGDEIPLEARLVAIADVYDALRSKRPYKAPMSHLEASRIIVEGAGKHFDPILVQCYTTVAGEFDHIWRVMGEGEPARHHGDQAEPGVSPPTGGAA